jgi:transposase, IS5 family
MGRCHLKGETGDRLHAVLCAAGYNNKWLLRMIAKKGVPLLASVFLRLNQASSLGRSWLAFVVAWVIQIAKTFSADRDVPRTHGRLHVADSLAA